MRKSTLSVAPASPLSSTGVVSSSSPLAAGATVTANNGVLPLARPPTSSSSSSSRLPSSLNINGRAGTFTSTNGDSNNNSSLRRAPTLTVFTATNTSPSSIANGGSTPTSSIRPKTPTAIPPPSTPDVAAAVAVAGRQSKDSSAGRRRTGNGRRTTNNNNTNTITTNGQRIRPPPLVGSPSLLPSTASPLGSRTSSGVNSGASSPLPHLTLASATLPVMVAAAGMVRVRRDQHVLMEQKGEPLRINALPPLTSFTATPSSSTSSSATSTSSMNDTLAERYRATMVLAIVGDAMGYKNGDWEFCKSGTIIHEQMITITRNRSGLPSDIDIDLKWRASDDTIMHLATARAVIAAGK
jgi:hypothetical protein